METKKQYGVFEIFFDLEGVAKFIYMSGDFYRIPKGMELNPTTRSGRVAIVDNINNGTIQHFTPRAGVAAFYSFLKQCIKVHTYNANAF